MGFLGGLLGRRQAQPDTSGWEPDGLGVAAIEHDEDSYADHGTAYQIGFTNPHLPGRGIVVTFYPVRHESGAWTVERRVQWAITDDPDAEPWFTDADYDQIGEGADDHDDALALAEQFAGEDEGAAGVELYGTWDGEPFDPAPA